MLNSLSIFETEGTNNGPTCQKYIQALAKTPFEEFKAKHQSTLLNKSNKNETTKIQNKCAVCTEEFGNQEKISTLDCKHAFHTECIVPWLQIQNTCPNCRFVLPKKETNLE